MPIVTDIKGLSPIFRLQDCECHMMPTVELPGNDTRTKKKFHNKSGDYNAGKHPNPRPIGERNKLI